MNFMKRVFNNNSVENGNPVSKAETNNPISKEVQMIIDSLNRNDDWQNLVPDNNMIHGILVNCYQYRSIKIELTKIIEQGEYIDVFILKREKIKLRLNNKEKEEVKKALKNMIETRAKTKRQKEEEKRKKEDLAAREVVTKELGD